MKDTKEADSLREAIETVESIKSDENLDSDRALQIAMLAELKTIRKQLDDIEVHTNNTVRKL